MNTPSPLIPQGTLEHQSKGKSTVRIAIFTIVSIHAVFFAGLLMQGCRHDDTKLRSADAGTNQNSLPPIDAGYYPSTQDVAQSSSNLAPVSSPAPNVVSESPIPLPTPVPIAESPADTKAYTVAKGDTLAKIAKANGVTVGALSRANPSVDASKLRPGQKLQVPAPGPNSAPALGYAEPGKGEPAPAAANGNVHSVKPGETLLRIAKQHGTTMKALRTANHLKSDRLVVGQKLKLPAGHAGATPNSAKTTTVSKLSATNPAHVNPIR